MARANALPPALDRLRRRTAHWAEGAIEAIKGYFAEDPEAPFADDVVAARHYGAGRAPRVTLAVLVGIVVIGIGWAAIATVEEVTRGEGRVIPTSKPQVVQSLEGGIVKEILVRVGSVVHKDQPLLRIDDTGFASSLGEVEAKQYALRAQIARLEAEVKNASTITFPEDLIAVAPAAVKSEQALFEIGQKNRANQLGVLEERKTQREQELSELRDTESRAKQSLDLAQQELNLNAPLARQGIVPRADYLRLQREVNELKGELENAQTRIPAAEAAVRESLKLLDDAGLTFQREAQTALTERQSELAVIQETLRAATDRVSRTEIRSPADGIVNTMNITTIGGVVRPGEDILEITPMDDTLLVEARVKPSDIAFIGPGQRAVVKLTAYDFSIYGSLEGTVERIGADALVDPKTGESYYTITVRTQESALKRGDEVLPIIPGMVATVDVITGKKSVLAYLFKPIIKARDEALRER